MSVKHFKRIESGKYKDTLTGVMLVKQCRDDWVISIDDYRHCAVSIGEL